MTKKIKDYDKLNENFKKIRKQLVDLTKTVTAIQKKSSLLGYYLSLGIDPYRTIDAETQQGPLVTKLFSQTEIAKELLKGIKK